MSNITNINNIKIKEILEQYNASPKKSFGQNFLLNSETAEKMASYIK